MDVLITRFPHISQQIFEQLDKKTLGKSREVKKSWKEYVDEKDLQWIQIVNIPTILKHGNTYLHVAARTGQSAVFEIILDSEEIKNPRNKEHETPFHIASKYGHWRIVELLILKSIDLNINLNATTLKNKLTAFHYACRHSGQPKLVELLMLSSFQFNIDLNAKSEECGRGEYLSLKITTLF